MFPPLNIMLNKNAEISRNDGGFCAKYPKYGAALYCSYNKTTGIDDFSETLRKRHERIALDSGSNVPEIYKYKNKEGNYSATIYYNLENCVTPVHFIATDSASFIVSGTIVLDNIGNQDSIAPVINYLNDDVSYLVKHLNFNGQNK